MNWVIRGIVIGAFGAILASALAQNDSAIGKWKTFDDKTARAKSIVQITEENGELTGKVLEVLESPAGPHPLCKPCEGERKDQPVEGMTILWGAKKNGALIRRMAKFIGLLSLCWTTERSWKCMATSVFPLSGAARSGNGRKNNDARQRYPHPVSDVTPT
jgi:hypothetical protein